MKRLLDRFRGPRQREESSAAVPRRPRAGKWDHQFRAWIEQARAAGKDPNDIGDQAWANDGLDEALERFYLPYIDAQSCVLELGPGSGRLTRHLASRCRRIVLVDNSAFVLEWIARYLQGRCEQESHLAAVPAIPDVKDQSVDLVVAHGVMEHLDFDETAFFLDEFFRVLKPGGHVSFNYNSLHGEGGAAWFRQHRKTPGTRCIFRFYVPEFMHRLAQLSGFAVELSHASDERLAHVVLRKPSPAS